MVQWEIRYLNNISVRELKGNHATQSTSTARPKLSARVNWLTGSATLSTQSVTVAAVAHTIFWTGAGTVTASGAYVGALTSGQTFTTTAGTLTLTVSGRSLRRNSTPERRRNGIAFVTDANNYDYPGFPLVHVFDGLTTPMSSRSRPASDQPALSSRRTVAPRPRSRLGRPSEPATNDQRHTRGQADLPSRTDGWRDNHRDELGNRSRSLGMTIDRTIIIPASAQSKAQALCAGLAGPAGAGMFIVVCQPLAAHPPRTTSAQAQSPTRWRHCCRASLSPRTQRAISRSRPRRECPMRCQPLLPRRGSRRPRRRSRRFTRPSMCLDQDPFAAMARPAATCSVPLP